MNLSAPGEILGVEPLKVGETLSSCRIGNPEPSSKSFGEGVETRRVAPKLKSISAW